MPLYDEITAALQDEQTVACVMESELEPTSGAGTPICPPTYAPDKSLGEKSPRFAVTAAGFIPAPDDTGWHHLLIRDGRETPRRACRVVVNSVGACAGINETGTYMQQHRLGLTLPAFVVTGTATGTVESAVAATKEKKKLTAQRVADVEASLAHQVNSWTLAHRTADSWLQYADGGNGRQIWADDDSDIKQVLLNISHERGDLVYGYAPNVAVYGAWLSSGTARRHAIPRAYTCEITGYGAVSLQRGATKLDPTGGTISDARSISTSDDGIGLTDKGGKKPAELGFGQVPASVTDRAFVCELILRKASISLRALDLFRYPDDVDGTKAFAAKRVYVLLAMAGHLLGGEDGFLRSGCDLVTVDERWGWRRHGSRTVVDMTVPSLTELAEALQQAVAAAEQVGLAFQEPVTVGFSAAQVGLIIDRVLKNATETVASAS
ncbi:hypothetical protein KEM60_02042 [Austwickia sp. TVS 96-490-7B]|uniref:type I-U CRISPR-associated protein Cas7 n=1 Tax=Austwickia sp. TVS 96-490-7B TaxID=2830843 RepID=UPI001C596522|nr:type I-U CRISPR-associated protein Cas7 [Austwickia sp. TVS 96-490-7B]MBW3085831.1 hypothetical protein [Austwickia sp. TVS 96-490-7B]